MAEIVDFTAICSQRGHDILTKQAAEPAIDIRVS